MQNNNERHTEYFLMEHVRMNFNKMYKFFAKYYTFNNIQEHTALKPYKKDKFKIGC